MSRGSNCRYIVYSLAKNQHFAPCWKNCALDRKMIATYLNGHDVLYRIAKFGRDRTTCAGCRCENMAFVCSFCHATACRRAVHSSGHTLNKYCVTVYGSILMLFQRLFGRDCSFRRTRDRRFLSPKHLWGTHIAVFVYDVRWRQILNRFCRQFSSSLR